MALVSCGHCIIGVICRVLRLGSCEFSSVEEDELAIFLLPMPVSLPGGKVGVYASFRTISFSFKAVRSEYLSRTQRLRKGGHFVHFAPGINWPRGLRRRTMDIYISIQAHILGRCLQHRGGEPERAKGADGMQLFALDCIAYIVDVETN